MKYRRNGDADLRDLERAWRTSGSEEDLARYNNERIRNGLNTPP